MPKIAVYPLQHHEYDDIVTALGMTREELAKRCGVSKDTIGWWRHSRSIPISHLMTIKAALDHRLRGRRDLNPVEQRARGFIEMALATGSAAKSRVVPEMGMQGFAVDQSARVTKTALSKMDLDHLIAEITRRGGVVTFGAKPRSNRNPRKKSK